MRRRRIIYSPAAERERIDIAIWLTQEASAMVARRFGKRVSDRVKALEYASERGTVCDDALGPRRWHPADCCGRLYRDRGRSDYSPRPSQWAKLAA